MAAMTKTEMLAFARHYVEGDLLQVMEAKGNDYSGGPAFGNFDRASVDLELSRTHIWYVYFSKHLDSLKRWIRDGKLESEPIESRITDLINYLLLLRGMIEEDKINGTD